MADEKDIDDPGQGGSKKKLILIIVAAVLLVLGAAAATFFLMAGDDEVEGAESSAPEVAEVEKGDPQYLKLDPAFVVNLPPGGPVKMLQLAVEVMTRNPNVVATLKANDPMIRHHLLNLLEQQQAAELLTVEGREALQQAVHELLSQKLKALKEPGEIEGVFFTQFVMQ